MPAELHGTRALGLIVGVVADWAMGDPRCGHPVDGFGVFAARLERWAWRPSRATGVVYTAGLVGGTTAAALWADRRVRDRPFFRLLLLAAATWSALGGRSLALAGQALADAVRHGELERARQLTPTLVGRDPSGLDAGELCRAAVESVAENTADAVVGRQPIVSGHQIELEHVGWR